MTSISNKVIKKPRPFRVCVACRKRKLRCDRLKPSCSRCTQSSSQCFYESYSLQSLAQEDRLSSINLLVNPEPSPDFNTTSHYSSSSSAKQTLPKIQNIQNAIPGMLNIENGVLYRSPPSFSVGSAMNISAPNTVSSSDLQQSNLVNKVSTISTNTQMEPKDAIQNYTYFVIPKLFKNMAIKLWEINDTIVVYQGSRFIEPPFSTHTLIQTDPYARVLCGCIHGISLLNFQKSLENKPNFDDKDTSERLTLDCLNPLVFLDKAILKYLEYEKFQSQSTIPLDFIYNHYDIDDNINPKLMAYLSIMINEIKAMLLDKDIDFLLKKFYENIYPFYPFIDICLFEEGLSKILNLNSRKRYEINIGDKDIRFKLETLTLFLVILSITLRFTPFNSTAFRLSRSRLNNQAKQFSIFANKVLYLLNVYKFTNENNLVCLLYIYVEQYLNPDNMEIHISHNGLLKLNSLFEYANTLGLYEQPLKYKRLSQLSTELPSNLINLRRKLWVGLQMLKFQTSLFEGEARKQDIEYCEAFFDEETNKINYFEENLNSSNGFDSTINLIMEKRYVFHIILLKLLTSYSLLTGKAELLPLLEKLKNAQDFMHVSFPIDSFSNMVASSDDSNKNEMFWRGSQVNYAHVENAENFKVNLIGLSTFMNVFYLISLYFERKCKYERETYQELFQTFFKEYMKAYAQLTKLVIEYLQGKYELHIPENFGGALKKLVCFVINRLWTSQTTFLFRLTYLKKFKANDYDKEYLDLIDKTIMQVSGHMRAVMDISEIELKDQYYGLFQSLTVFRYISYIFYSDSIIDLVESYWLRPISEQLKTKRVDSKIFMKWGIHINDSRYIMDDLKNPNVLFNYSKSVLEEIDVIFDRTLLNLQPRGATVSPNSIYNMNNSDELLNQFLENNSEWLSKIIDGYLGELPLI